MSLGNSASTSAHPGSKQKDYSDYLKASTPFIGPLLILLGVVRLIFFYSFFNVQILSFLELSEVLTSFLDIIMIAVILTTAILITTLVIVTIINKREAYPKLSRLLNQNLSLSILGFLTSIAVWFGLQGLDGRTKADTYSSYFPILAASILGILFSYLFNRKSLHKNSPYFYNVVKPFAFFTLIIICFLLLLLVTTYNDYSLIKHHKSNQNIKVKLDNGELANDSLHYYIGNTKNYLFYYDEVNERTYVFPMSRVKELSFDIPYTPREKANLIEEGKINTSSQRAPIVKDLPDSIVTQMKVVSSVDSSSK